MGNIETIGFKDFQLMFSGTFVASRLSLIPFAVSKLVICRRQETETKDIAQELPEG